MSFLECLIKNISELMSQFFFFSLGSIAKVFDRGHVQTAEVLLRGCPKLPLPHYPGVTDMFWQVVRNHMNLLEEALFVDFLCTLQLQVNISNTKIFLIHYMYSVYIRASQRKPLKDLHSMKISSLNIYDSTVVHVKCVH